MRFRAAVRQAAIQGGRSWTERTAIRTGLWIAPGRMKRKALQAIEDTAMDLLTVGSDETIELTRGQQEVQAWLTRTAIDVSGTEKETRAAIRRKLRDEENNWEQFLEFLIEFLPVLLAFIEALVEIFGSTIAYIVGATSLFAGAVGRAAAILLVTSCVAGFATAQTIEGPATARVGEKVTVTITPTVEGECVILLVDNNNVVQHRMTVGSSTNEDVARAIILYDGNRIRPLALGRLIGDRQMNKYLGPGGVLSVIPVNVEDETGETPSGLAAVIGVADELPQLVLLSEDRVILKTMACPLTVPEITPHLPDVPERARLAPLTPVDQIPNVEALGIPDGARMLLQTEEEMQGLDDYEKANAAFPFGLRAQAPLRAMDAEFPILDPQDWEETHWRLLVWHVFRQIDGHCASNATAAMIMLQRELQGLPRVVLSPEQLFHRHSYWGQGSTLWENRNEVMTVGICDRATVPQENWRPRNWPADWRDNAIRHRVLNSHYFSGDTETIWRKVCTAIQHGYFVNIGITWPSGGGHSVVALDLVKVDGEWCLLILNSWGESWGERGMGILTREQCRTLRYYGAFTIESCRVPSDEAEQVVSTPLVATQPAEQELSLAP